MNKPEKYVVILELDNGYMDCIAICDKASEAYGEAYLALSEGLDEAEYYVSFAERREGDNGIVMEAIDKDTGRVIQWATILFYRNEMEVEHEKSND